MPIGKNDTNSSLWTTNGKSRSDTPGAFLFLILVMGRIKPIGQLPIIHRCL